MRQLILFTLSAVVALYALPKASNAEAPNIILILTDDQRYDNLGTAGHPVLKTPEIDRLASEGTRFLNAFVTSPICAASRASIFTGVPEREHRFTFGQPPLSSVLASTAYPRLLKEAGYRTGFFGKLGIAVESSSDDIWFDSSEKIFRNPYLKTQPDGSKKHTAEIVTDHAIEFLKSSLDSKPFCLSISYNSPHAEDSDLDDHYPFPESSKTLYSDEAMPLPRLRSPEIFEKMPDFLKQSMNRDRFYWRWDTEEKYNKNLRNYFRMISGIDHQIGRLRQALDDLEISKNTVVIFTSDNGYYMGNRGFAGKWSHFDESIRVPLIIYNPLVGAKQRPRTRSELVLNIDLAPTILEIAGMHSRKSYKGMSLVPLIEKGANELRWREFFQCEHLMDHERIPKWRGIHTGELMYANYFEQDPEYVFLHDLKKDPDQLRNLASDLDYREIRSNLEAKLERETLDN